MQGRPGAHWCNIRATGNGGDGSGAVTMTSGISLRAPGAILLISCYELGHQPLGAAWPRAFLERAGYAPDTLDLAVEPLDEAKVRRARLAGIAVPMHTALRIGTRAAERIRELNPGCLIVFYGLYALLNQDYLLGPFAEAVLGGEFEGALVRIAERIEAGEDPRARCAAPPPLPPPPPPASLDRLAFPVPSRGSLPGLTRYVSLSRDGRLTPAGYVEASRGCLHECLHCPIPPVYGGRFFAVPRDVVLEDVRRLVAAGAGHITFGDPDFLNGPGHALSVEIAEERETVVEGIDRLSHESFRRDREPSVEGCAAGLSDRIRRTPSVSSRLILCRCDEAGRHQTLQLSIDVTDAQSDARALLVGLHQRVTVDGLAVRHQGKENVAQH